MTADVELQPLLPHQVDASSSATDRPSTQTAAPSGARPDDACAAGVPPPLITIRNEIEDRYAEESPSITDARSSPAASAAENIDTSAFTSNKDVQWVLSIMEMNMRAGNAQEAFEELKQELDQSEPRALHQFIDFLIFHWGNRLKWRTPSAQKLRADAIRIVEEILTKAKNKHEVLEHVDGGNTLLSYAIELEDLELVQALVRAGANVNYVNVIGGTALQVAAKASHQMLKYLLASGTFKNTTTQNIVGALHSAARFGSIESVKLLLQEFGDEQLAWQSKMGLTVWHEIALGDSIEIAYYLFQNGIPNYRLGLNVVDNDGRTPLFIAIDRSMEKMTALFLRHGAALSVDGEKHSALEMIARGFANPTGFLEDFFDYCVYKRESRHKYNAASCSIPNVIYVDYKVLVHAEDKGKSQINVLQELVSWKQSKLLRHPMIESLIYVKWKCALPVFYVILATYATFLCSLNIFVITTFNMLDARNRSWCGAAAAGNAVSAAALATGSLCDEGCEWHYWLLSAFIYVSVTVIFVQECMLMSFSGLRYVCVSPLSWRRWAPRVEPCAKVAGLALALAVPPLVPCARAAQPWQRHAACAALLLAWLQAMLLLARFPGWGYYVFMFERVAINILKIFATSICLVIGFSICFIVQYQSKPPFDGPVAAFVKTLVMMSSEFDYEGLFDEQHERELAGSRTFVRLMFVVFVVFIAIVLMNFMIGVAVSDVSELAAHGDVRRLEKQLELLNTIEGLGKTVIAKFSRRLSSIRYHRAISKPSYLFDPLSTTDYSGRKWRVAYSKQTFDSFQLSLTSELQNAIHNNTRKKKNLTDNAVDAVYEATVEKNHSGKDDSNLTETTLKDRNRSLEAGINETVDRNKEMLEMVINDLKEANHRIESIESKHDEIKESIDDIKESMKSLLAILDNDNRTKFTMK